MQHVESSLSHGFMLFWIKLKNLITEQKDLSFPDEPLELGLMDISNNLKNLVSEPCISGVVFSVFFIPCSMRWKEIPGISSELMALKVIFLK